MRPVRRYRVKGGPPGRSPGAYSRWVWNLLPLCRYRRPAAPQTGEVTRVVRGSVGGDDYLRHPIPSLPCGHLCGHSGAALRILARTHTEKPPSSDGGFSVSYRQLRTQADSHRNRASHFADLCLTTWLRRRRTANLMCDNKFRNQVDAIAPHGLTRRAMAWGTARAFDALISQPGRRQDRW
jgi:hypothetical protein